MSIRGFFTRKKIIWIIIILLIGAGGWYLVSKGKNKTGNIQTAQVSRQDIRQTVLTTGQVVSALNLNLSFQTNGVVKKVNVKSGDKVKAGDILAILNQANAQATLVSARGALAQAQANYQKVLAGSTPEQIQVAEKAVNAAQVAYDNSVSQLATVQQSTSAAIDQAQSTLNDLQSPTTQSDNKRSAIVVTIANQLAAAQSALDKENQILSDNNLKDTFSVSNAGSLISFRNDYDQALPLLAKANTSLAAAQAYKSDANINQAVSDAINVLNKNVSALNNCFSALLNSIPSAKITQAQIDAYKTSVNTYQSNENAGLSSIRSAQQALTDALTAAQNALTNANLSAKQQVTSAQNQINSAHAAWLQSKANLAQMQAKAQPADISAAKAQILSAQGQVDAAQAAFDNTILKAPADGTITQVDTKVGEQANALQEVMVLQDINALHVEAYVSEANIADLKSGQTVDYTFDALGPDRHFPGTILTINPASTVISGVVDYLVKADFPPVPEIKPGMTANLTVLVAEKKQALAIPSSAIINQDGQSSVKVIDNPQTKSYRTIPVETGLSADGGLTEITAGLEAGQEIVTYIKP
ncbi:MAG: efflux RND transporter periplasmic adaptor subunit [Patescibacteria group bacterium]